MNAREKLDEFAEATGMNKCSLIGWSIAADFADGKDEWNLDLPPFVITLCAHWQALINTMPF